MKQDENQVIAISQMEKKKRRSKLSANRIIFFLLFLLIVVGVLFTPLFSAKNIEVTEMERYTKGEVCEKIGLSEQDNIFLFSKRRAKKVLENDPYISSAKVSFKLPDTMVVSIEERKVRGYLPYMGAYLYIDEYGRVLDTQTSFSVARPVVEGLKFDQFQLGELLQVDNPASFDIVVKMAQMITKYELLDTVVKIDVKNPEEVYAYVNKITIYLGNMDLADEKIRTMAEILKTLSPEDRGTLDLGDMSKPIVFRYLT